MENSFNNSEEEVAYTTMLHASEQGIDSQYVNDPGPEDEDEEDTEMEEGFEEEETSNGDDNPPLDEDIVHSPVPTQTGGRPKSDTGR